MQFSRDGEWYQVIRITGPSHNLFALRFDESGASAVIVENLSTSSELAIIEADQVKAKVLDEVAEANITLRTNYHVAGIRFVGTDTPPCDVYYYLAKAVVKQAKAS